jgi:hypothetical protein
VSFGPKKYPEREKEKESDESFSPTGLYFFFPFHSRKRMKSYSQSKAPFFHSYTNPIVEISRNTIIDQNPNEPILLRETAQGNKKVTSESDIMNKIETR